MIKYILKKDTLLLAIITSASYCAAYFYEFGYSNYFNYPKDLISISIMNLLQMGFGIFMFTFIMIGVIDVAVSLIKISGIIGKIAANLISYLLLAIIMLLILYLVGSVSFKYFSIAIGVFLLLVIIVSIPYKKKSKNILESINESIEDNLKDRRDSVKEIRKTTELLSVFFLLILSSLLITAIGTYSARTKENFYTIEKDNIRYLIVNKCDDYLGAKVIDDNKEFGEKTYIFNIGELNGKPMEKIKIVTNN